MLDINFMSKIPSIAAYLLLLSAPSGTAWAQNSATPFDRLTECQAISNAEERLACYDDRMTVVRAATAAGDVIIAERAAVDAAKRAMFGFTTPSLPSVFGGDDIESLETTLERATLTPNGAWIFYLADGSIWRQIDNTRVPSPHTRHGEEVRVRKAALGSYFLNLGSSRAVRVRRE